MRRHEVHLDMGNRSCEITRAALLFLAVALVGTVASADEKPRRPANAPVPYFDSRPMETDPALLELIKSIEDNEALYRNLEVRFTEEYRRLIFPENESVVATRTTKQHVIEQQGMHSSTREEHKTTTKSIGANATVLDDYRSVKTDGGRYAVTSGRRKAGLWAQIHRGDPEQHVRHFIPHTVLLPSIWTRNVLLSELLKADDFPGGHPYAVEIVGDEQLNQLDCVKVDLKFLSRDGSHHSTSRIWLARDRNFLPIKVEHLRPLNFIVEATEASDFRELEPGIWMPFQMIITVQSGDQKNSMAQSETVTHMESATLKPSYDLSLFRDIKFPAGTKVDFFHENGHQIRSVVIADGDPMCEDKPDTGLIGPIVVLNLLIMIVAIYITRVMTIRQMRGESGASTPTVQSRQQTPARRY